MEKSGPMIGGQSSSGNGMEQSQCGSTESWKRIRKSTGKRKESCVRGTSWEHQS